MRENSLRFPGDLCDGIAGYFESLPNQAQKNKMGAKDSVNARRHKELEFW
jgi:hypothetical protein